MTVDQLRVLWTVVGLTGSILAIAAWGVLRWCLSDAKRYAWAVNQVVTHPQLGLMREQADAELTDAKWLLRVATALLLVATSMAAAGFAALLGQGATAIPLLVASEILVVVCVGLLVWLGWSKMQRRNAVRQAVRLNRPGVKEAP